MSLVQKVFECQHPYEPNMNTYEDVSFPGATKILIEFDPTSRTESGCDYVQFLATGTRTSLHPSIQSFSGRDGSQTWPGCEGKGQ